ncbi:lipoate--protein ligase family protein [Metallumcola ferriviriculae]|uniref:lipoate--protein ligase n=1 Tax=Metallumcola ferriviriculae TaxID=3039180 RepID=A0AAU0USI9_9FIRM|nr:lipoate--protein ligase family protein [Desulfitibacteraceae bacterium MK1]
MKLFKLGIVPGYEAMTVFHALARLNIEALVLVSPEQPLVSVGYFQDTQRVLDVEACRRMGLPVIRREVGGGTVLLDKNQIFYHVVMKKDNPNFPASVDQLYRLFSQPPINTYRHFGVEARFKPVNDLITPEGKKIAGEGGANISDCMVFVGSIILDFDIDTMVKILRVPDEKFRDKVQKTMAQGMSTLALELGQMPDRAEVEQSLVQEFEKILGPLEPSELTREIKDEMRAVEEKLTAKKFLFEERHQRHQAVKVKSGTFVGQGNYKATGGLISTTVSYCEGIIENASISGDFTINPKEALVELEKTLTGVDADQMIIETALQETILKNGLDIPGVTASDIAQAVSNALPKE